MKPGFIILSLFVLCACSQAGSGNNQSDNQQDQEYKVKISTDLGDIVLKLYNETPVHRDNFLSLTRDGFFDGTLFHRVINQFMIQGGDPSSKEAQPGQPLGSGGPDYTLPAEIIEGKIHRKGALAAARQGDHVNPERRSSGSQFYIVHGRTFTHEELDVLAQRSGMVLTDLQKSVYSTVGGAPHLDNAYTVFGEVVSGLNIVDKIAATQTGPGDRPVNNISMTVSVVE
jgi:cyclophilin family peptidyl-prolyl cis-trans isomerase